ncbi:MAG: hypothetical protein IPH13_18080 [Planctomycetes bacterium]|nr:hypothetical protein [Planctomycetota bacterium]
MIRSTVHGLVAGALAALACSPFAFAQVAPGAPGSDGGKSTQLDAFFARHGDGWKVAVDVAAGKPTFVWGQRIPHQGNAPRTDVEFVAAAIGAVDTNADVFGFDSRELKLNRVEFLDLAKFGSSDKVAVSFDQVVDGIPVVAGHVTVLFDRASGDVIALDTTGVPGVGAIDLVPNGTLDAAIAAANVAYQQKLGAPALSVDDVTMGVMGPSIHWGRKNVLAERGPTLVYVLELSSPGFLSLEDVPAQARVYVSAEGDATVFHVEATAHAVIGGNASGHTNTGGETNTTTNQETVALPFMHVRNGSAGGAILATTDESGNFSIAGNGPTNLFFELRGPYVNVNNGQGADSSFTITGATNAAPVNVMFNPANTEFPSGEMAAYHWVNQFRLWVKSVDAADTSMDFQVVADVNQNSVAGITTCNAVWVGNAIQFLKTGGGCSNTSYRPVVLHEEGHWANDVYNNDSGMSGAFHEGNADAWAYTITDSPCLDSFLGAGCLRSALQTSVKKCASDGSESCNGGASHTEGQALASAIWKVRDNLNVSLGNVAGDAVHDALFLGWMQSFNDKTIVNVIQDHWLALDDDDANVGNGTPHFTEITTGFKAYNWPTIALPDLAFTSVVGPAQNASVSPFQGNQITATITSLLGSVASAQVRFSVNNGAFQNLAMAPTGNPNEWSALIPGQANQTSVRWYVHATGTASGSQLDSPAAGANGPNVYHHGLFVQLAFFNFEAGTDEGWTHVNLSGSNGDQWQRNNPAASNEGSDPTAAFSGTRVWGTDLSATGTDGKYEPSSSGELRSPTFNFSGSSSVKLQFKRWLAVEEGAFDQASVRVNGTQVWTNPASGDLLDGAWTNQELDISAQAANNASVQLAFRLTSDGGLEYGGWNLDDVLLYRLDPAPAGFFATYGAGCAGTGGLVPALSGSGVPAAGNGITISVTNGKPSSSGTLLLATAQGSASLGSGCTLLLGGTILPTAITLPLNGSGAVSLPALLPPGTPSVDLFMQFFPADSGSANGVYSATNGLQMHIQ